MHSKDTPVGTTTFPNPVALRLSPLMRVYGAVSHDQITTARQHMETVMEDLERISVQMGAYCCDDSFGEPNLADLAAEELALALECLSEPTR